PPPASSTATSPSTPPAATTAPDDHPAHHPENDNGTTPNAGSGRPRCLETSQGALGRIRTCAHGSGGRCSFGAGGRTGGGRTGSSTMDRARPGDVRQTALVTLQS